MPRPNVAKPLILASTSRYRKELLSRLGLPFESLPPDIEEQQRPGETPLQNCQRLALEKAQAIARQHPDAIIIGSDQVLDLNGEAVSKPGNFDTALSQLLRCQGKTLSCHTALTVIDASTSTVLHDVISTEIVYRQLSETELREYLEREQPYDAAGAIKVETAGIALLSAVRSDDPTAIIGLPLIRLTDFLRQLNHL